MEASCVRESSKPGGYDTAVPYQPSKEMCQRHLGVLFVAGGVMHLSSILFSLTSSFLLNIPSMWLYIQYILACIWAVLIHYAGHKRWNLRWFRAHTEEHHVRLYPPVRYLNTQQLVSSDPNAKFYLPVMIFPFLSTLWFVQSVSASLLSAAYIIFLLYVTDRMHAAFHLAGHYLEKFAWFQYLRALHFLHHKGSMLTNFGILDFFVDYLMGSLMLS